MGTPRQDNHSSSAVKPVTKSYGKIVLTLKNCLLPDEKLSPTPSQNDGLDHETETDLRILGCELIQTAGILLKLPQVSIKCVCCMILKKVQFPPIFYLLFLVNFRCEIYFIVK